MNGIRVAAVAALGLAMGACAGNRPPEPAAPTEPSAAERYEALPDTSVCVVDRTTSRGLRNLAAKREADGRVVLLVSGKMRSLEDLHPVGVVAGYAGRESWVAGSEPIPVQGRRYVRVGGERRVPIEALQQLGEHQAIPVFSDPKDTTPPRAVYVPLRPGCVFQAFVREDLVTSG